MALPNKEARADEPQSRGGAVPRDGRGAGQVGTAWDESGNHGLEEEAKDSEVVEPAEPCRGRAGQPQYRSRNERQEEPLGVVLECLASVIYTEDHEQGVVQRQHHHDDSRTGQECLAPPARKILAHEVAKDSPHHA